MSEETKFRLKGCALTLPLLIYLAAWLMSEGLILRFLGIVVAVILIIMAIFGVMMFAEGEWPQD